MGIITRADTADAGIWDAVATGREYRIEHLRLQSTDVVLDVGAHIGSFTYFALDRGAGRVVSVEPEPANLALLIHNILVSCHAGDRCIVVGAAVGPPGRAGYGYRPSSDPANTGGGGVTTAADAPLQVAAVPYWDLLELAAPSPGAVRLVKLDCEGGEWPVLEGLCDFGNRVQAWVGEYHLGAEQAAGRGPDWIEGRFASCGYAVRTEPKGSALGLFWAWRPGGELA